MASFGPFSKHSKIACEMVVMFFCLCSCESHNTSPETSSTPKVGNMDQAKGSDGSSRQAEGSANLQRAYTGGDLDDLSIVFLDDTTQSSEARTKSDLEVGKIVQLFLQGKNPDGTVGLVREGVSWRILDDELRVRVDANSGEIMAIDAMDGVKIAARFRDHEVRGILNFKFRSDENRKSLGGAKEFSGASTLVQNADNSVVLNWSVDDDRINGFRLAYAPTGANPISSCRDAQNGAVKIIDESVLTATIRNYSVKGLNSGASYEFQLCPLQKVDFKGQPLVREAQHSQVILVAP